MRGDMERKRKEDQEVKIGMKNTEINWEEINKRKKIEDGGK
jgi:hypothetical protein